MARARTDVEYLEALSRLSKRLGLPPTLQELADELEMSSAPAVHGRLRVLNEAGLVERRTDDRNATRLWRLTRKGKRAMKQ